MARDYETKAVAQFLLPNQPNEGNFTLRVAFKAAMKVYRHNHACVMEEREQWKQSEHIEDACREAEAARAKAAADKARREAAERSRKRRRLEEEVDEEAETGTSTEPCKRCIAKGEYVCGFMSPC